MKRDEYIQHLKDQFAEGGFEAIMPMVQAALDREGPVHEVMKFLLFDENDVPFEINAMTGIGNRLHLPDAKTRTIETYVRESEQPEDFMNGWAGRFRFSKRTSID